MVFLGFMVERTQLHLTVELTFDQCRFSRQVKSGVDKSDEGAYRSSALTKHELVLQQIFRERSKRSKFHFNF